MSRNPWFCLARIALGRRWAAKSSVVWLRSLLAVIGAGTLFCGMSGRAADGGGRIAGVLLSNAHVQLQFHTTSGNSYQVQSISTVNRRFWTDVLPPLSATGSVATVLAPALGPIGFFRVLEFTNRTFWYDWAYYYETPVLTNWGLGSIQNAYVHNDRPYDWYIDQADTGPSASANCGPSSVTMALKWYDLGFTNSAADARATYPEGGGWWYTWDINNYLDAFSVPNTNVWFTGTNQLMEILSQGSLVILDINTAYLRTDSANEHRVGRFYSYAGGHFVVVKGWRMVDNALFFELYDPYNWHETYADGSPKGRNRHIPATDLANAISAWWNYLIVISRPTWAGQNPL